MDIPLFQRAVSALSVGNHTDGAQMLVQVQCAPNLVESLIHQVLLGTSPCTINSSGEGGHHAHYYAWRLISSAVVRDWQTRHSQQFKELLLFISNYINTHASSPYSGHQGLAKSLLAESSSLWAVLWKLRLAEQLNGTKEDSHAQVSSSTSIHETFMELGTVVQESFDLAIRHASEPTQGESTIISHGFCNIISLIEEFGLYHKESLRRGVSTGVHERLRHYFKKKLLARILDATLGLVETATKTFSSLPLSGGETIRMSDYCSVLKMSAILLNTILVWKFENVSFMNGSVSRVGGIMGTNNIPEVLNIEVDKDDTIELDLWRGIFQKSAAKGSVIPKYSSACVFEVVSKALSAVFGVLKHTAVKNQYYDEKLKSIALDLLKSFVQLCSVRCDFWDPLGRAMYAAEGWRIASQLCIGDIWTCSNILNSSNYTGSDPPPIGELITTASYAMHRIVHSIGTTDAIFYHSDLGNTFITPLKHVSLFLIGKLKESTIESMLAKINHNDAYSGGEEQILEAFDQILHTWLEIVRIGLHDVSNRIMLSETVVNQIGNDASEVLHAFLKTKIEIHGEIAETMTKLAASGLEEAETSHALEYGNSNTQLMAIIGRDQCEKVCGFLLSSFRDLSRVLLNDYLVPGRTSPPIALQEAIWYVLSIIGEFIADAPESERPCIPMSIISHALVCERKYPNAESEASRIANNSFFSLCGEVFQFVESVIPHLASGNVSPAIVESLLEVLRRYIGTYLFADESLQADYCEVFNVVFEGGASVARVAFKLAAQCLSCGFSQDPDVVKRVMSLLQASICLPKQFALWANSEGIVDIFVTILRDSGPVTNGKTIGSRATLSGVNRGHLLAFIISIISDMSFDVIEAAVESAGGGCFSSEATDIDYNAIDCPIKDFIVSIVAEELGEKLSIAITGSEISSSMVIDLIKTVQGSVEGFKMQSATKIAFIAGYKELLTLCVKAAVTVHQREKDKRVLVAALECLDSVVELVGMFLPDKMFLSIIEISLNITQYIHFVMDESRRLDSQLTSKELRSQEEDERILVMSATAKLVLTVATWGLMNEFTCESGGVKNETVSQLVVNGLLTVLQLMDESTALIPELRDVVFKALKEVVVSHTRALILIDSTQSACVLSAVEFAAASGVPDLVNTSLSIMKAFATYYRRHPGDSQVGALIPITAHFFQRVVTMCLMESIDPSVVATAAAALQELLSIHGTEALHTLLDQLIGTFPLTRSAAALLKEAAALISYTSPRKDVSNAFMAAVERCVLTAQGASVIE